MSDKEILNLTFRGIDYYNRAVFKIEFKSIYVGSTDTLVPNKELKTKKDIISYFQKHTEELVIFGSSFNCEPLGAKINKIYKLKILDND